MTATLQPLAGLADLCDPRCCCARSSASAPAAPLDGSALHRAPCGMLDAQRRRSRLRRAGLSLPGEADIAREIGKNVDPDAIFAARKALREAIGRGLAADAARALRVARRGRRLFARCGRRRAPRAAQRRARSLRRGQRRADCTLALTQFTRARNHDRQDRRASAFSPIAPGPARKRALEAFYETYTSDPLVDRQMVRAAGDDPRSGRRSRASAAHGSPGLLARQTPIALRALIGAFAAANQTQLQCADGSGYEFVAAIVLQLDAKNPQVAARLLGASELAHARAAAPGLAEAATAPNRRPRGPLVPDDRDIVDALAGVNCALSICRVKTCINRLDKLARRDSE